MALNRSVAITALIFLAGSTLAGQHSKLAAEVQKTFDATETYDKFFEKASSMPADDATERKLNALVRSLAPSVTARSVRYICLHEKFGEYRADVALNWGLLKSKELGIGFFESLLDASDPRLRSAGMNVLSDLAEQPAYRSSLNRILLDCLHFVDKHHEDSMFFVSKIAVRARTPAAIDLLKTIALKGDLYTRSSAIDSLFEIGSAQSIATIRDLKDTMSAETDKLGKRLDQFGKRSPSN